MASFGSLDAIDHRILAVLQRNARTTNKELAQKAGLSPSACLRRVRALEAGGAIEGYRAQIAPRALGIRLQAMVSLRLRLHSRAAFDDLRAALRVLPEVIDVYALGGTTDLLLHVGVRDAQHLRDLTMDHLATQDEVGHIETAVIFDHERVGALPDLRGSAG